METLCGGEVDVPGQRLLVGIFPQRVRMSLVICISLARIAKSKYLRGPGWLVQIIQHFEAASIVGVQAGHVPFRVNFLGSYYCITAA